MQIKERGKNKQLAINMVASLLTFVVGLGIRFFLTPYIVRTLGAEAYGFIGLSANILSYTGLITIALNSMSGRFIAIKYQEGNIIEANKYYASVFYSNLVLASIILLFGVGSVIWLEYMINIPDYLITDVKILFSLLVVNNIAGLIFGLWGIGTFIKNRLDLSNIRGIIGNFINATILIVSFSLFSPHIWYMGLAGLALTAYSIITNFKFTRILTPDLRVKITNFEWGKVVELLKSGVWNLINNLNNILGFGLDLLIANIFISSTYMGIFALTKNVPFLILSLFQTIASVFAPIFTQLFAKKQKQELLVELLKSIRILGFFSTIPLACLYVWGADFYNIWLHGQDAHLLQLITILGTMEYIITMPVESLWNIFTITNKLKYSTLIVLASCIMIFATVIITMFITDSHFIRLIVLASARSAIGFIRALTFLPLYGSYCLDLPKHIFYKPMFKSALCTLVVLALLFMIKPFFIIDSWAALIGVGILSVIISCLVNSLIILTKDDRQFIMTKILKIRK